MKLFDTHVHDYHSRKKHERYSPKDAVLAAKEAGLDGILYLSHNSFDNVKEAVEQGKRHELIVVPTTEISLYEFVHPTRVRMRHILAAGVPEQMLNERKLRSRRKRELYVREHLGAIKLPLISGREDVLKKTIQFIRQELQGQLIIAPHVERDRRDKLKQFNLSFPEIEDNIDDFDAIEAGHVIYEDGIDQGTMNFCDHHGKAKLGASDAHMLNIIGLICTQVPSYVKNPEDFIGAVKAKEVSPYIPNIDRLKMIQSRVNRPFQNNAWSVAV